MNYKSVYLQPTTVLYFHLLTVAAKVL